MSSTYENVVSLYPQLLFFVLICLCYVRNVSYAYAFVGYIGNSIMNAALKQMFRNLIGDAGKRPMPYHSTNMYDKVISSIWVNYHENQLYGFPSGHAQSIGYYLAFVYHFFPWKSWNPFVNVAHLMFAIYLLYTRISFKRHTFIQVLFGFLFGVVAFYAFDWVWNRLNHHIHHGI